MALILAISVFLVVGGIIVLVMLLTGGGKNKEVMRRLEAVEKAQRHGAVSQELQLLRDELLSDVPVVHQILLRWSWSMRLRKFLAQAGLDMKPGKLMLLSAVLGSGAVLVLKWLVFPLPVIIVAGPIAALLPLAVVAIKRHMRLRAFEKNFPEAIDLLCRAVRAGHSFTTGLEMIATELPEPLASEFRTLFDEQNFGLPLREALLNLVDRVPLIDVRFFVTALLIQKDTGGNLAEILENLAHVIRERFRIYGEIRVRTAHGRITAGILMILPIVMGIVLWGLNPSYMRVMIEDPLGPVMLVTAAVMQIVGAAIIWKIVQIEV